MDNTGERIVESDRPPSVLFSKTKNGLKTLKTQKNLLLTHTTEISKPQLINNQLLNAGSFDTYAPVSYFQTDKDSLTEEREARRHSNMDVYDRNRSAKNSHRRISENLNLKSPPRLEDEPILGSAPRVPIDKNSDSYNKRFTKRKKKTNSINYMKNKTGPNSSRHNRTNSRTNVGQNNKL